MVWSRCSALRTVIEHHNVGILRQYGVHLSVIFEYVLRLMLHCRQREVYGKYGIWINQYVEVVVKALYLLLLRTVLLAQEAWALAYRGLVYRSSG